MSQVNSYDRERYATNGVTKTFSFGWDVNDKSDVKVKFVDDNGVIVEYATFIDPNDQEYTTSNFSFVVELNRQGGTITFVDTPAENQNIIIYRQTELVYENSFKTATAFPAVAIDNAYRKIWLAIQEVQSDAKHNTVRMTSDQRGLTFDEFSDTVNNHLVYYASGSLHFTDFTTYDIADAIYWAGQVQKAIEDAAEALDRANNAITIANNADAKAEQARQDASAAVQTATNAYNLASTALQPGDNVSELYNDAGYITLGDIPTLQYKIMPQASAQYAGQVVQYIGLSGTYTHGYIYECAPSGSDTLVFTPNDVSCLWDNLKTFLADEGVDYDRVFSGDMTYYQDATLWRIVFKDQNGNTVLDYQQYVEDWEDVGFVFGRTFADEETVLFERVPSGSYIWQRINVQPSCETYIHDQAVASAVWTINHNLGKYPSITVVDTGGNVVTGKYTYPDANTIVAEFNSAFKGTAYLN